MNIKDGEKFLEESCLRLREWSMIPTAQSMMTTARSMTPSLQAIYAYKTRRTNPF